MKASVIVTLPFAFFHLPAWMVEFGLLQLHLALLLTGVFGISQLFGRVVIMWLYNNTGYSVRLVGMFHSSFNVTTSAFDPFIPREMSFLIAAGVVAVGAVLTVVSTRGRLLTSRSAGHGDQQPSNRASGLDRVLLTCASSGQGRRASHRRGNPPPKITGRWGQPV